MKNIPAIHLKDHEHILFLGDSLTRRGSRRNGFITLIRKTFQALPEFEAIRITGAGISGDRVPDLQARLERDVLRKNPTLVILFIGINDVWHSRFGSGTPESEFRSGLHSLIRCITVSGARLLHCTPSVIGEKSAGQNSLDTRLECYAEISRQVARTFSIPVLDLRRLFVEHLAEINPYDREKGVLTSDGVHLNKAGNRFMADCLLKVFSIPI